MQDTNDGKNEKQSGLSWSTPATPLQNQPAAMPAKPAAAPATAAASQDASSSAKYIGFVVMGVFLGVLLAWGWTTWRGSSSPASTTATSTLTATTNTSSNGTLGVDTSTLPALGANPGLSIVSPQKPGRSVAIDKAIVQAPTWVVIYEDNAGKPGNALGAALFFPERQKGTVELLRGTVAGKSYLAVKQVDNGDRKFSLKDDQVLTEGGKTEWVSFKVQ